MSILRRIVNAFFVPFTFALLAVLGTPASVSADNIYFVNITNETGRTPIDLTLNFTSPISDPVDIRAPSGVTVSNLTATGDSVSMDFSPGLGNGYPSGFIQIQISASVEPSFDASNYGTWSFATAPTTVAITLDTGTGNGNTTLSITPPLPEPSAFILMSTGLVGLFSYHRHRLRLQRVRHLA
jgi:hypothetical protein